MIYIVVVVVVAVVVVVVDVVVVVSILVVCLGWVFFCALFRFAFLEFFFLLRIFGMQHITWTTTCLQTVRCDGFGRGESLFYIYSWK